MALKASLQNDVVDVAVKGVNAEAYDLYLRGQQKLRVYMVPSLKEAASYFEQAIALDPELIPAYYGLGVAYVWQVIDGNVAVAENRQKLRDVLRRGLRLAPDDPGLLALSGQLARYDVDMPLAEERFMSALQKDPSNSVVRMLYPNFKLDQSHPDEALRLSRRSLEIDPLNPLLYIAVWASYMDLGDAQQAVAAAAHYRELAASSDDTGDNMTSLTKLLLSGDIVGGISDARRAALRNGSPDWLAMLHYFIGDLQTAHTLMEAAPRVSQNGPLEAYRLLAYGNVAEARRVAVAATTAPQKVWGGQDINVMFVRLAVDAMIEDGEDSGLSTFWRSWRRTMPTTKQPRTSTQRTSRRRRFR